MRGTSGGRCGCSETKTPLYERGDGMYTHSLRGGRASRLAGSFSMCARRTRHTRERIGREKSDERKRSRGDLAGTCSFWDWVP